MLNVLWWVSQLPVAVARWPWLDSANQSSITRSTRLPCRHAASEACSDTAKIAQRRIFNIREGSLSSLSDPRLCYRPYRRKRPFSPGLLFAECRAMRSFSWLFGCLLIVACSGSSISIDASPETQAAGGQSGGGTGGATGGSEGKTDGGSAGGTMLGTGGATAGTGGATAGTGGAVGGSGGASGKDGGGSDAGLSCSQIETMYRDALTAARHCKVGATDQCRSTAAPDLTGCFVNCVIPVNDNSVVNQLKTEWTQAHCDLPGRPIACPAIACLPPKGVCQPAAGAGDGGGLCVNQGLPTQ
jgi:hypothetical protein